MSWKQTVDRQKLKRDERGGGRWISGALVDYPVCCAGKSAHALTKTFLWEDEARVGTH